MPFFFFFNDTATTEIYTLSLHDALPILDHTTRTESPAWRASSRRSARVPRPDDAPSHAVTNCGAPSDRKSTRLNSSHVRISYAVFCLKKKKLNVIFYQLFIMVQ